MIEFEVLTRRVHRKHLQLLKRHTQLRRNLVLLQWDNREGVLRAPIKGSTLEEYKHFVCMFVFESSDKGVSFEILIDISGN